MKASVAYAPSTTGTGRFQLHDLYLATGRHLVPLTGPQAPSFDQAAAAAAAAAALPLRSSSRMASAAPSPSAPASPASVSLQMPNNSAFGDNASDVVLRTAVTEWYCPGCLAVGKRRDDKCCTSCFVCPGCAHAPLEYRRRAGVAPATAPAAASSVTFNLACVHCGWSSHDDAPSRADLNTTWYKKASLDLKQHHEDLVEAINYASGTFSTASSGTGVDSDRWRAAAARLCMHPVIFRNHELEQQHEALRQRCSAAPNAAMRLAHLRNLGRASGAGLTVRELCDPDRPWADAATSVPVSAEILAGAAARNHPSVVALSMQDLTRTAIRARLGLKTMPVEKRLDDGDSAAAASSSFGGGRSSSPNFHNSMSSSSFGLQIADAPAPAYPLRTQPAALVLRRVALVPRFAVQSVAAHEATSPNAHCRPVSTLAPVNVVIRGPDVDGHDYAYHALALAKLSQDDSLNAARLVPSIALCPLYQAPLPSPAAESGAAAHPVGFQPSDLIRHLPAASSKAADRLDRYVLAVFVAGTLKNQHTTLKGVAVDHAACKNCSVVSSLPLFNTASSDSGTTENSGGGANGDVAGSAGGYRPPVLLCRRTEVSNSALLRYGLHWSAFQTTTAAAVAAATIDADAAASPPKPLTATFANIASGQPLADAVVRSRGSAAPAPADATEEEEALKADLAVAATAGINSAALIDAGHRVAFALVVTDRRAAASRSMRVPLRIDAVVGGVAVSYGALVELRGDGVGLRLATA